MAKYKVSKANKHGVTLAVAEDDLPLGFMADLVHSRKGWTYEQAFQAVTLLKQGGNFKQIGATLKRSESGVKSFLRELARAGQKGYSLKQYLAAGRPCR